MDLKDKMQEAISSKLITGYENQIKDINAAAIACAEIANIEIESAKPKWISVEERLPENTGAYLCMTNDGLCAVCCVAVNGWWRIAISGKHYADMGKIVRDSKEVEREVTHWMPLPCKP